MSVKINDMFVTLVWKVWRLNLRYERGSDLSPGILQTLSGITLKLDKSKALPF